MLAWAFGLRLSAKRRAWSTDSHVGFWALRRAESAAQVEAGLQWGDHEWRDVLYLGIGVMMGWIGEVWLAGTE